MSTSGVGLASKADPADDGPGHSAEVVRVAESVATHSGNMATAAEPTVVRMEPVSVVRVEPAQKVMLPVGDEEKAHGGAATLAAVPASGGHSGGGMSGPPHWTYEGTDGPEHWDDLWPEWRTCKSGRNQSPIDIPTGLVVKSNSLDLLYQPIPLDVLNNGHTIQVNNGAGSYITVAGVRYNLAQLHFHSPSEHTVGGHSYPLEMHLVHKNSAGDLAVVGLLFDSGAANPVLQSIWQYAPTGANQTNRAPSIAVDVHSMISLDRGYVYYDGSLTTPPCTEGVKWFVVNQTSYVSPEQVQQFRNVIHQNNRPVQFLLGRKVYRNQ